MRYVSKSAMQTLEIAAELGFSAKAGDIFCLTGELGAGKTEFARGLAVGLGFSGVVSSPTFNLLNVYKGGRLVLYHFDFYRLEHGMVDVSDIGIEDYFFDGQVCAVEWPDRLGEAFFSDAVWVDFVVTSNGEREIMVRL